MSRRYEAALAKFNQELDRLQQDAKATRQLTMDTARKFRSGEITEVEANAAAECTMARRKFEQARREIVARGIEAILGQLAELTPNVVLR